MIAVNVCYEAEGGGDDYTKTYPYATGWSRSAMDSAIHDLNSIVTDLREENND